MRAVVFGNREVVIPNWVVDHASFCKWALSDDYPEHGRFGYFNDDFWGDLDLESEDHNLLKTIIGAVLTMLTITDKLGIYYGDRMMLSHTEVGLATEPDGMFVRAETRRSGRITVRRGQVGRGRDNGNSPFALLALSAFASIFGLRIEIGPNLMRWHSQHLGNREHSRRGHPFPLIDCLCADFAAGGDFEQAKARLAQRSNSSVVPCRHGRLLQFPCANIQVILCKNCNG